MKKDLTFQALSLFSQDLGQIEPIFQKTACMNVDDAETIGMLEGIKVFLDEEKDKEFFAFLAKAQAFMEIMGAARWTGKGELTNLGFRLTHKNKQEHDLSTDIIDEVEINTEAAE